MLNLDHQPVKLVSTEGMREEEWLKWRKKGLGGSDAAVVMGCSPYRTKRDLYYDKAGMANALPDEHNWVAKEIGHRLEGLVADLFARKTGYHVWEEKAMFQHPLYPFMLANVDRFVQLPDGQKGVLEIKTTHYQNKYAWADDQIPRHYELQGRFYMAVMDLDFCFFACLFGNNENDLIIRRIQRDLDEEAILINELQNFWNNYVLAKVEPPLTERGDLLLDTLNRHYGPGESSAPAVSLPRDCLASLKTYLAYKEQKAALDKASRELEKQMKAASAPIIDHMGGNAFAVLAAGDTEYRVSYASSFKTTLNKAQCDLLKLKYPDIYDELAVMTETRPFKVEAVTKARASA